MKDRKLKLENSDRRKISLLKSSILKSQNLVRNAKILKSKTQN
jgi:hypothetical protein